jgi:hypothetical protein
MKYRQWFFVALSPLLLVVALVGVRSFGGSGGVASAHTGTGSAHLEIDMNGDGGWCTDIDTTAIHAAGVPYEVAICLSEDTDAPPQAFNVELLYDDTLNSCTDKANVSPMDDDNPDANSGVTTWGTSLGTGWDCSGSLPALNPVCDKDPTHTGPGKGLAFITCASTAGPWTLPIGETVSAPIAVVTLHASSPGVDNLDLANVAVYVPYGLDPLNTFGATDTKTGGTQPTPTVTPTRTTVPTATSTPSCGGVEQDPCPTSTVTPRAWTKTPTPEPTGTPTPTEPAPPPPPPPPPPPSGGTMPQVVPPGTGTGSGSVDWTISLMWTLAGAGALSVFLGGLYLRRARNR